MLQHTLFAGPHSVLILLVIYAALAAVFSLRSGRGSHETSTHFLHTSRDLSLLLLSLSFLAANCSALEVLTMVAIAARYGLYAVHFYWLGAIPALVFLVGWVLPVYQAAGVRTVPEFLGQRYTPLARGLAAALFALMMVALASITLCLWCRLIHFSLGCSYSLALWAAVAALALFLASGGLTAVIRAEAAQLVIFLIILIPVSTHTLANWHGVHRLLQSLPSGNRHSLAGLPWFAPDAPADLLGTIAGLCLVLGFSYWCGDVLLVQRLLAARDLKEMSRTPALAIFTKLLLPILLIVPGLGFAASHTSITGSYDLALPQLLQESYPHALLSVALAALLASLFTGMAGNIAAAVALFVHDLYRPSLRRAQPDAHYTRAARATAVALSACAGLCATFAFSSRSLMEYVQIVLGVINVPVATVLLLGALTPAARRSGVPAMLAGSGAGLLHALLATRYIHYGSGLAASFYGAIVSASATLFASAVFSWGSKSVPPATIPLEAHLKLRFPLTIGACALLATLLLYAHFQ